MEQQIILTTGTYDLIKEHIRREKVSPAEAEMLHNQLKNAVQVLRRELPEDVVAINTRVTIRQQPDNQEKEYIFVSPDKAKPKRKTTSILTKIGLALVGFKAGDVVNWKFDDEEKQIEIVKVERLH